MEGPLCDSWAFSWCPPLTEGARWLSGVCVTRELMQTDKAVYRKATAFQPDPLVDLMVKDESVSLSLSLSMAFQLYQ